MQRRQFLSLTAVATAGATAGCSKVLSDTTEATTPTPAPGNDTNSSFRGKATPTDPSQSDRELYVNAFRIELLLSGINVDRAEGKTDSIVLDYYTRSTNEADLFRDTLTIAQQYYNELLAQGYWPDRLEVWVFNPDTQDMTRRYRVQTDWVIDWADRETTRGQFLARVEETIETEG